MPRDGDPALPQTLNLSHANHQPLGRLVFHGLQDPALHSDGLDDTWDWIDSDLTLVTVPDAGPFIRREAAELVTETMRWWLTMRR